MEEIGKALIGEHHDTFRIMDTDNTAASYRVDICGWVSRHGNFFGKDEELARWDGCTHVACKQCGEPTTEKQYTHCASCREVKTIARYNAREHKIWNEQTVLYSETLDRYFNNISEVKEELKEGETLADLRLVICEPVYLKQIDPEYWMDDLSDDGELPEAVCCALKALNVAIQKVGPVSWIPGNYAVDLGKNLLRNKFSERRSNQKRI